MRLTDEEKLIISQRRDEFHRAKQARLTYQKILKQAIEFERWLINNSMAPSFSTFCNEFGYQYDDAKLIYSGVIKVRVDLYKYCYEYSPKGN